MLNGLAFSSLGYKGMTKLSIITLEILLSTMVKVDRINIAIQKALNNSKHIEKIVKTIIFFQVLI